MARTSKTLINHCIDCNKEIILTNLLDSLLFNKYKYVGDGTCAIAGKFPDFINKTDKKNN